jgi:DNA-binding CsgD family transcriptional regulator
VSLAHDADRLWDFGFVHAHAALVPAARGDWAVAVDHLDQAWLWAEGFGIGAAMGFAATARASLEAARRDPDGVLDAADAIRRVGPIGALGRPGVYGWRVFEAEALLDKERLDDAEDAIAELEAAIPASGLASAEVAVARLRGTLAWCRNDAVAADDAFRVAWSSAARLRMPFDIARLELADGRRLRSADRKAEAIDRLLAARKRLTRMGAQPWVETCERELSTCGAVHLDTSEAASKFGLTPTELVVARLVATGMSNREVAAELFVSVKAVEFHVGHIFDKLGVRSRRQIAGVLEGQRPDRSPV